MGEDKNQALSAGSPKNQDRISERTLHELALIGGFAGIIIGAEVFNHKTSKSAFWPPVGASIAFWVIFLVELVDEGLLRLSV